MSIIMKKKTQLVTLEYILVVIYNHFLLIYYYNRFRYKYYMVEKYIRDIHTYIFFNTRCFLEAFADIGKYLLLIQDV